MALLRQCSQRCNLPLRSYTSSLQRGTEPALWRPWARPQHRVFIARASTRGGATARIGSTPALNPMTFLKRLAFRRGSSSATGLGGFDTPFGGAARQVWLSGQGLLSRWAAQYRAWNSSRPFALGFALCFAKGVLADTFAQKVVERRERLDRPRVLAMALFSGAFCGCCYHYLFNVAFPRAFGAVKSLRSILVKTAADGVFVFPFLYMPTFYMINDGVRLGSLAGVTQRWFGEIGGSMQEYVKVWPATMLCVFSVIPVELRVSFIASVSFVWLVVLSVIAN